VQDFVELTKAIDSYEHKVLELDIESLALKKQLARELSELYKDQRVIFTEYKKGSSTFTVRKWYQKAPHHNQYQNQYNNQNNGHA
jgi:DNA polymerase III delta subunit